MIRLTLPVVVEVRGQTYRFTHFQIADRVYCRPGHPEFLRQDTFRRAVRGEITWLKLLAGVPLL